MKLSTIDLPTFCKGVVDECRSRIGAKHRIAFTSDHRIPSTSMDASLLHQILDELITNAIRYSPNDSEVWVNLSYSFGYFILQVHDQGIGIPSYEQKSVFQKFYRASNVHSMSGESGAGSGLSLVQQNTQLLQGHVCIHSLLRYGTSVIVIIPHK